MKIPRIAVIVMAVAVALGGWTWRESARTRALDAARIGLARERMDAARNRPKLEARIARAAEEAKAASAALAQHSIKPAPPKNGAMAGSPATAPNTTDPWERIKRRDPTVQALEIEAKRAKAAINFGPLIRAMELSPAQAETFVQNEIMRWENQADTQAATESLGLSDQDPAMTRVRWEAYERYLSAQRALLGEEGLRRLVEFETTLPLRESVQDIAAAALANGEPLTRQQAEQVTQILLEAAPPATPRYYPGLADIDWAQVDARARAILTDTQFSIFQNTDPAMQGYGWRFATKLKQVIKNAQAADATTAKPGG